MNKRNTFLLEQSHVKNDIICFNIQLERERKLLNTEKYFSYAFTNDFYK